MLSVRELTVAYDGHRAVDGIDLTVRDRTIVGVLGASGSGKSTLLRAVAGLIEPQAGAVEWDGDDLRGVPVHRRGFGLMFQDHALFPHRDVLGNVAFGLRMQHLPRADVSARAHEALELVGLGSFGHRRIDELSGGEQQRVALARALAPRPRLLMLDEPLGSLDRALRERLVGELRALFVELGLTVLFVTHDHDEAFALADRVAVVHDGRVVQEGEPDEVWSAPRDAVVARFVGWNVSPVFEDAERTGSAGGAVAVRPVDITLHGAEVAGAELSGAVQRVTRRPDHVLVAVDVGVADPVLVVLPPGAPVPDPGDVVGLTIRPGARRPVHDGAP